MNRNRRNNEPQSPTVALLVGVFSVCFGIFWTVMAASMFPPMAIFGILFIAISAVSGYEAYKKAKANSEKQHEHQVFEEIKEPRAQKEELRCPYCGAPIHSSDTECEYCNSRL